MTIYKNKIHTLAIVVFFIFLSAVYADEYHYVNMLAGNRAIGLGGAYTAISDDPAGCYYNPAGITFAPNNGLSGSVNAFYQSLKVYKSAMLQQDGHMLDWEQESFSILPNFFGVVRKLGNGTLGFSYVVPDAIQRRQKQTFSNIESNLRDNDIETFTININDSDRTYLFGPSYAYQISSSLSVGGSLYAYYRDKELIRNQILLFEQGQHYLFNYYETSTDWGFRPILGIMWEPVEKLAVGFTLSKIYITSSDNEAQRITRDTTLNNPDVVGSVSYDYSNTDTIYFGNSSDSIKGDFPLTLSLGLAYFASPRLLFSGDLVYSEEIGSKGEVLNFAVGSEYFFTEQYAVRFGFYSDYANTPDLRSNYVNQTENIDIYSASLSFTMYHSSAGITLGCLYGFGKGDAQIIANNAAIQDVEISNLAVYLSASYNY
ncbi:MAG: outer membrane protein transport protein [Pseudomonadota bacterium]